MADLEFDKNINEKKVNWVGSWSSLKYFDSKLIKQNKGRVAVICSRFLCNGNTVVPNDLSEIKPSLAGKKVKKIIDEAIGLSKQMDEAKLNFV